MAILDYDKDREDKYVENGGSYCPVCGSDNIEHDARPEVDAVEAMAVCYAYCRDCQSNWLEVWTLTLTGLTNINTMEERE